MQQKQNNNRFIGFQEEEETATPVVKKQETAKKPDPSKKVVVKVQKTTEADMTKGDFEMIAENRPQTASRGARGGEGRGGRGGRGGEGRGGRGGRGGEGRGGRGGKPRPGTAKVEGEEGEMVKDRPNREFKKYEGKAREGAHPYDRKDGTGRAHRGDRKGGDSKGTWGNERKATTEEVEGATEERKGNDKPRRAQTDRPPRERRERREGGERRGPRRDQEEEKEEAPVEEEEVGFTLDDYQAKKQAESTGLELQGKARANEKVNMKNLQDAEDTRGSQFSTTFATGITGRDTHVVKPGEGAAMFGFTESSGDFMRTKTEGAQPKKGGRKGKLVKDDNEFPAFGL